MSRPLRRSSKSRLLLLNKRVVLRYRERFRGETRRTLPTPEAITSTLHNLSCPKLRATRPMNLTLLRLTTYLNREGKKRSRGSETKSGGKVYSTSSRAAVSAKSSMTLPRNSTKTRPRRRKIDKSQRYGRAWRMWFRIAWKTSSRGTSKWAREVNSPSREILLKGLKGFKSRWESEAKCHGP